MTLSKSITHKTKLAQVSSNLRGASVIKINAATTASSYSLTDLGTLGGHLSVAKDINDSAQIVGYSINSNGQRRAFVWNPDNGMQ